MPKKKMEKPEEPETEVIDLQEKLNSALKSLKKKFGEESVLSGTTRVRRDVIPTGSVLVDVASGVGGIPLGILAEIFGAESSGKTSLTLSIMGQAQKKGLLVGFVDAEQSLSLDWAQKLGVDLDKLIIAQPSSMEEGIEIVKMMIENGVQLVVFDSVAAAPVRAEVEGEAGDNVIGVKARIMSKATSAMLPLLKRANATVIFINQIREKVGVVYGNPETTPGGKALKFNASMRLRLSKSQIRSEGTKVGDDIKVTFVKNKVARPFKEATIRLIYDKGFDVAYELAQAGLDVGIFERRGAMYFPMWPAKNGEEKYRGMSQLIEDLQSNEEFVKEVKEQIYSKLSGNGQEKANED